jgi:hypothetical protein
VDLIVGDHELALEFTAAKRIRTTDPQEMRVLLAEPSVGRAIVVSRKTNPHTTDVRIDILPWRTFRRMLWGGALA